MAQWLTIGDAEMVIHVTLHGVMPPFYKKKKKKTISKPVQIHYVGLKQT